MLGGYYFLSFLTIRVLHSHVVDGFTPTSVISIYHHKDLKIDTIKSCMIKLVSDLLKIMYLLTVLWFHLKLTRVVT
jgi:hypothetical protein